MGKTVLAVVVVAVLVVVGMLVYPTIHWNWIGINTTGWLPITKAGAVIVSYGFIFFMIYLAVKSFSSKR